MRRYLDDWIGGAWSAKRENGILELTPVPAESRVDLRDSCLVWRIRKVLPPYISGAEYAIFVEEMKDPYHRVTVDTIISDPDNYGYFFIGNNLFILFGSCKEEVISVGERRQFYTVQAAAWAISWSMMVLAPYKDEYRYARWDRSFKSK